MTKAFDRGALVDRNKELFSREKIKSQGDSLSDVKTLAGFLETLMIPNEIKDIVFSTL